MSYLQNCNFYAGKFLADISLNIRHKNHRNMVYMGRVVLVVGRVVLVVGRYSIVS